MKKFGMRHLVLAVLIVLPTITASSAFQSSAQDPSPPPADGSRRGGGPARVIDGAKNPELIDTELLIAQILGSNALPPAPTADQERRLTFFARRIGLGSRDTQILRSEMIRLYAEMTPVRERLQERRTGVAADLAEFRDVRLQSYGRLLELLSADGRRKLNDFIEAQKRNTRQSAPSQPQ
jgi:hypothetical protein